MSCKGRKTKGYMPKRIFRERTKGWRMPQNTIYVGRPSKWGNPYNWKVIGISSALGAYRKELEWYLSGDGCCLKKTEEVKAGLAELRGKNLACWCPLSEPCHADILLEISNKKQF